jgi:hypothetical protein
MVGRLLNFEKDLKVFNHGYLRLVLSTDQKLPSGLLATITPEVGLFSGYSPFPVLLPFCKRILDTVSCGCVPHHLRFRLDHLSCITFNEGSRQKSQGQMRHVG